MTERGKKGITVLKGEGLHDRKVGGGVWGEEERRKGGREGREEGKGNKVDSVGI